MNLQRERRLPERGWFNEYLARRPSARSTGSSHFSSCSLAVSQNEYQAIIQKKPSSKNLPQLLNDKIDVVETQSCGLESTGVVFWFLFWVHAS